MTRLCYVPKRFSPEVMKVITAADRLIENYERQGFSLTLRQLYYQFVQRGWLPNEDREYKRLGSIISDARLAGLLSWAAIQDRTRNLRGLSFYSDTSAAIRGLSASYRLDLWADQEWRPEVWVEKEALVDVVGQIANRLRVDFFACKGYNSQSEQWAAGQRFAGYIRRGQRPIVFHLGDHDPSGIDMTRDNQERLSLFAGVPIPVMRLALNRDQIEELKPPPNPAKVTDARFEAYRREHGDESWELDALDPAHIQRLIEAAVMRIRDEAKWDAALSREVSDRRELEAYASGGSESFDPSDL